MPPAGSGSSASPPTRPATGWPNWPGTCSWISTTPASRSGFIRDHDRKFGRAFETVVTAAGRQILTTPIRAPRANAIAERFVGSLRRELLDRILIVNRRHAAVVLAEYEQHFNQHRPHRALGQAAPLRPLPNQHPRQDFRVRRRDRLGGLLHEYRQVA